MLKTEKIERIDKATVTEKKDWKVVLFFGDQFALLKKMKVVEIPSTSLPPVSITTDPILSVDFDTNDFSMFNTGPCRYIGINVFRYANRQIPIAFANTIPQVMEKLQLQAVSLKQNTFNFVRTIVRISKVQKLKDTLYHIFTDDDSEFFVTVEK